METAPCFFLFIQLFLFGENRLKVYKKYSKVSGFGWHPIFQISTSFCSSIYLQNLANLFPPACNLPKIESSASKQLIKKSYKLKEINRPVFKSLIHGLHWFLKHYVTNIFYLNLFICF